MQSYYGFEGKTPYSDKLSCKFSVVSCKKATQHGASRKGRRGGGAQGKFSNYIEADSRLCGFQLK